MKRPAISLWFSIAISAISFLGCDDDSKDSAYDLYVFGDQNSKGTLWKNGAIQPEPLLSRYLFGGFVSGKDFYVAGIGEGGVPTKPVAKYWKNGNEVALSDGTLEDWAYDVAATSSDVYAVGYDDHVNGATLRAKYWKNGNAVVLGDGINASGTTDVVISGSDFYIAGWENVNNNDSIVGRVWKNGVRMNVPTNSRYYYVEGIAASGNDLYLVGYESNEFGFKTAKYWKNGVGTYLDDDAYATDVVVYNGDVYISGIKDGMAGYWKNGAFTPLTDQRSNTESIAIYDHDVLVAGNILDSNNQNGIVWKNGVAVAPFLGTDPSIHISGALPVKR